MPAIDPATVHAYIALVDQLAGRPVQPAARANAIAVALTPMLQLGARLGPWPDQRPAGPHDSIADAP